MPFLPINRGWTEFVLNPHDRCSKTRNSESTSFRKCRSPVPKLGNMGAKMGAIGYGRKLGW